MKNFDLVIARRISKSGSPYVCLIADLGYRKAPINFDAGLCAELAGMTRADLENLLLSQGQIEIE